MTTQTPPRLLTPTEVADRLRVHPTTLATWRRTNAGPRWIQLSERLIRYDRRDLVTWQRLR